WVVLDRDVVRERRIVDEHVDRTERAAGVVEEPFAFRRLGDVRRDRLRHAAGSLDLGDCRFERARERMIALPPSAGYRAHAPPLGREEPRDFGSDTAARSRHYDHLSVQSTHRRLRNARSGQSSVMKMQWRIFASIAFDRWPLPHVSSTSTTSPAPMRRASPSLAVIWTPASRLTMYCRRGAGCQSRS